MNKKIPIAFACLFFWFINLSLTFTPARVYAQASVGVNAHVVTAIDYCTFLNTEASTDPRHLYDAQMSSNSPAGAIVRVGTPGSYEYFVIAGRENGPITFVNRNDEEAYCDWAGVSIVDGEENSTHYPLPITHYSASLADGSCGFEVETISTPTLSLATLAAHLSSSDSFKPAYLLLLLPFVGMVSEDALVAHQEGALAHEASAQPSLLSAEEERAEIHQFLRTTICQEQTALDPLYEKADQHWLQREQAWDESRVLRRMAKSKHDERQLALQMLHAVQEAREKIDLEQTILGCISRVADNATPALHLVGSLIPAPAPLGTISSGVAIAADWANNIWANRDVTAAEKKFRELSEKSEASNVEADRSRKEASCADHQAKNEEELAQAMARAAIKKSAAQWLPPMTSLNPGEWSSWASALTGDTSFQERIKQQGLADVAWVHDLMTELRQERLQLSKQVVENHKAQKAILLKPLDERLQHIEAIALQARKKAAAAKAELKDAIENQSFEAKILEKTHEDLTECENSSSLRSIDRKRQKFSDCFKSFQAACALLEEKKTAAVCANQIATETEASSS